MFFGSNGITIGLLIALSTVSLHSPSAAQDEPLGPKEWIVKTYSFPSHELNYGFGDKSDPFETTPTPEKSTILKAPQLPPPNASESVIEDFMVRSHHVLAEYCKLDHYTFPEGSILLFDPKTFTLTARLPRAYHDDLQFLVSSFLLGTDSYLETELVILEAPAATVRALLDGVSLNTDQSVELQQLEEAAQTGNAEIHYRGRLDCRSGQRASLQVPEEQSTPKAISINQDGSINYLQDQDKKKPILEIDAVLSPEEEIIDIQSSLAYHYSPVLRRLPEIDVAGRTIPQTVTDHLSSSLVSQHSYHRNQAVLLSAWTPPVFADSDAAHQTLHAAFLTGKVVRLLPDTIPLLEEYITYHGETLFPIPQTPPKPPHAGNSGMETLEIPCPPIFASYNGGAPADPFSTEPSLSRPSIRISSVREALENAGVDFPEGAYARYNTETSMLLVRNLPEQLDLAQAYVNSTFYCGEGSVPVFTFHVIEGSREVINESLKNTSGHHDHTKEWKRIKDSGETTLLGTWWHGSRSGQRSKQISGREYIFPITEQEGGSPLPDGLACEFDSELVGTIIEVDPVLGADNYTIDIHLSFQHDYAPPLISGKEGQFAEPIPLPDLTTTFYRATIETQTVVQAGTMRLLGTWQPEGSNTMQALFMKVDLLSVSRN